MPEGAHYQPHSPSKTALTAVVLLHGVAIAALALHKMEVITVSPRGPIDVVDILDPPPPPEVPPEPVKTPPQQPSSIDLVPPVVPTPPRPTEIVLEPMPELPVVPSRVADTVIETPPSPPPPPPPPPPPRTVEPARAKANLASYVSDADYPASAARNEEQGATRFRLTVGPDGRVQQCTVTGSSGSSALDNATCRIMRSRARFSAARDSNGNPTADTVSSTIRWVLPDG